MGLAPEFNVDDCAAAVGASADQEKNATNIVKTSAAQIRPGDRCMVCIIAMTEADATGKQVSGYP